MKKLDWDKLNTKKRVERYGSVGLSFAEMPLSWSDVIEGLAPLHLQASLKEFVRMVIVADLNHSELPNIPEELQLTLQHHIERKGGLLPFAKWLIDVDIVKGGEERRLKEIKKKLEKQLLHQTAKCELGFIDAEGVIANIPACLQIQEKIIDKKSLMKWAKSRSNFNDIVTHKRREKKKKREPLHDVVVEIRRQRRVNKLLSSPELKD